MTIMLLGCFLGFASGVIAFTLFGFGLFLSIVIWAVSGPLSVVALATLHALRSGETVSPIAAKPQIA